MRGAFLDIGVSLGVGSELQGGLEGWGEEDVGGEGVEAVVCGGGVDVDEDVVDAEFGFVGGGKLAFIVVIKLHVTLKGWEMGEKREVRMTRHRMSKRSYFLTFVQLLGDNQSHGRHLSQKRCTARM